MTLFPSSALRGIRVTPCKRVLTAANGTAIRVDGEVTVEAAAGGHKFQIIGVVSDHISEISLGNDFLHEHEVIWNFRDKKIEFDGHRFKLCGGAKKRWCQSVVIQSNITISPHSEAIVPSKVVYNDLSSPKGQGQVWATETRRLLCGIQVSRAIVPDSDVDVPVRLLNLRNAEATLRIVSVLADLEPAEVCSVDDEPNENGVDVCQEIICEMVSRVDPSVPLSVKQELLKLLKEYKETFSTGENDLGRTQMATHRIETIESRPVRQPLRRPRRCMTKSLNSKCRTC